MCGIFGWQFTDRPPKARFHAMASALASCNDTRGGDSWGVYAPSESHYARGLGKISSGVGAKSLAGHLSLMAHTRNATTGHVLKKNSHPFLKGGTYLAHNGIVTNHHALNLDYGRKCDVDSEHLAIHVAKGLPLNKIESWGAIEYSRQSDPSKIFLCRFNGGSLSVCRCDWGIFWTSDFRHLKIALHCLGSEKAVEVVAKDSVVYAIAKGDIAVSHEVDIGQANWSDVCYDNRCATGYNGAYNSRVKPDWKSRWANEGWCEEPPGSGKWTNCKVHSERRRLPGGWPEYDTCTTCGMDQAIEGDELGRCIICAQFDETGRTDRYAG